MKKTTLVLIASDNEYNRIKALADKESALTDAHCIPKEWGGAYFKAGYENGAPYSKEIVLFKIGVGKVNAAIRTTAALEVVNQRYKMGEELVVMNVGFCGGIKGLKGRTIPVTTVAELDFDTTAFDGGEWIPN